MATVFIGMVYWLDGKLTPIQDVPSEPVYTFSTKCNRRLQSAKLQGEKQEQIKLL